MENPKKLYKAQWVFCWKNPFFFQPWWGWGVIFTHWTYLSLWTIGSFNSVYALQTSFFITNSSNLIKVNIFIIFNVFTQDRGVNEFRRFGRKSEKLDFKLPQFSQKTMKNIHNFRRGKWFSKKWGMIFFGNIHPWVSIRDNKFVTRQPWSLIKVIESGYRRNIMFSLGV